MTNSILFCTPAYGGQVTDPFHKSALRLEAALTIGGIAHDWLPGKNESLVHRARMEQTRAFLYESDHSHMMWIDADIEFDPEDVAKLWNLGTDIAVAAYSMKRPDMPLSAWKDGRLVTIEDCPKVPFPVDYAGTGFMMISRAAVVRVREYLEARESKCRALADRLRHYLSSDELPLLNAMLEGVASSYEGPHGRVPALYMTPIHNDGLESEDYHFCRIARETGMQIIMDPSIRLGHWGLSRYGAA